MRTGATLLLGLLLSLTLVGPVQAQGQDFNQLLQAVDKLEASLKSMVDQERDARKQESAQIRQEVQQLKDGGVVVTAESGVDNTLLAELAIQVKALRNDVDQMRQSQVQPVLTQSDVSQITSDIEYVKSELNALRGVTSAQQTKLASLDDQGFYVPEKSDQMEQLAQRLTTINQQLEQSLAKMNQPQQNSPSVGHGKIKIGGLIHEHYSATEGAQSSFQSKRVWLTVGGELNDYATYSFIGDFAGTPKLVYGYLTVSPVKWLSTTLGQFKALFCTDYLKSAGNMPFVSGAMAQTLGPTLDIGMAVSFRQKFNDNYSILLSSGVFNGAGSNTTDANSTKDVMMRGEVKLAGMFTVAPSFHVGKTNVADSVKQDKTDFAGSLTWAWRNEIVEAEYIHSKVGETKRNGWYAYAGHTINVGTKFLPQIQVLARYEQQDLNMDISDNRTDRVTVGTNLFLDKNFTKLQLNYSLNGVEGDSDRTGEFQVNGQVSF